MAINLPGSSSGLPVSAAHKKRQQQAQEPELAASSVPNPFKEEISADSGMNAGEDVFEKRLDAPKREGTRTPESPGSDDELALEKFLKELYADAAQEAEMPLIQPEPIQRPRLRRTETYFSFPKLEGGATAEEEPVPAPGQPLPEGLEMRSPRSRRNAGLSIEPERMSAFRNRAGSESEGQSTQPTRLPRNRHHQRTRLKREDTLALLKEAKLRAALKAANKRMAAASPASQERLMQLMQTPYQYVLMGRGNIVPFLSPEQAANSLKEAHKVVVGDMHGSFQKLVETLVTSDMVEMPPMAARKFVLLATMANNRKLPEDKLQHIYKDMLAVVSTMRWKGGDRQFVLIGDVLADRGPLDSITLDIVEHLRKQAPKRIISLASNHDHAALSYLSSNEENILPEQATSMFRALKVAEASQTLEQLAGQYFDYLAQSELMHYDQDSNTLLVHAPISVRQLKKLHKLLPKDTPAVDDIKDADGVKRFVDAANQFYQDYVKQNHEVVMDKLVEHKTGKQNPGAYDREVRLSERRKQVESVLVSETGFLWVRNLLKKRESLPFAQADVTTLVHGHDTQSILKSPFSLFKMGDKEPGYTVVSLDQEVRKGSSEPTDDDLKSVYVLA